jgi:hypothetical protein
MQAIESYQIDIYGVTFFHMQAIETYQIDIFGDILGTKLERWHQGMVL